MKIQTSKADIIWSYLGYFFSYGTNLLILLFVMRRLDTELLGLWYTFLSVGSLVQILDFGISSTLIRNVTYAWSGVSAIKKEGFESFEDGNNEPNYILLGKILFTSKNICMVIAVIALVVMGLAGTPYIFYVAREISISKYLAAWILFVMATFLNIYYIFWPDSLKGVGDIKDAQIAIVVSRLIQIIVAIAGARIGNGLIGLSLAYLIMGIVLRVLSKKYLFQYHDIGNKIRSYNIKNSFFQTKSIFITIWHNAKKAGIVSLSTFLFRQTSTLVCSAYVSLTETASYGLCVQLIGTLAAVSCIWFKAESPMLVSLKVENNIQELKKHFSLCVYIYWLVFLSGILVISTIGIRLLNFIQYNTTLPLGMLLFVALVNCLEYNHSIFCEYITMSNNVPYFKASTITGVTVAILTVFSGMFAGNIYILIFVQFIVQLVYNNWKWPKVVLSELRMSPASFMVLGNMEFKERILSKIIHKVKAKN